MRSGSSLGWVLVASLIAAGGCDDEADLLPDAGVPNEVAVEGTVYGLKSATGLSGLSVATSAPGAPITTVTTDAQGKYATTLPVGPSLLAFESEDHGPLLKVVDVPDVDTASFDAFVAPATAKASLSISKGGSVSDPAGAVLKLPPDAVQGAGSIDVRLSSVVPKGGGSAGSAMPGGGIAKGGGGADAPVRLKGALGVTLKDANGASAQLKAGASAGVEIPVGGIGGPAQLELLSLDETTGKWVVEGTAFKVPGSSQSKYRGRVSHLSFWAVGSVATPGCLEGCVVDGSGTPAEGAAVRLLASDGSYARTLIAGADGCYETTAPADLELTVAATAGPMASQTATGVPSATGCDPVPTLTLASPAPADEGCPAGYLACGDACVDPATDPDHCGGCDRPCADGTNGPAGATCVAGVCACAAGQSACPGDPTDVCLDTDGDELNCGECGNPCDPGSVCRSGSCTATSCGDGVVHEGERCHSPLPLAYAVGTSPGALASADFDGDGRTDVAVITADDTVEVLFATGRGTHERATPIPTGAEPLDVTAADYDGDGDADLVVAARQGGPGTGGLHLHRNDGTGSFSEDAPVAIQRPWKVASGDLDGDGDADFAVTSRDVAEVRAAIQDASGGFSVVGATLPTVGRGVDVAHLDGDASEEISIVRVEVDTSNTLVEGFDLLAGTLMSAGPSPATTALTAPLGLVRADVSGNGQLDAVVGPDTGTGGSPVIFPADATGVLGAGYPIDGMLFADGGAVIDVANIDGDATDAEVAVADPATGQVYLYKFSTPGVDFTLLGTVPVGTGPAEALLDDLDGDGTADLTVSNGGDGTVSMHRLLAGGSSSQPRATHTAVAGDFARRPMVADLNNDGLDDLVVIRRDAPGVSVLLGRPAASPAPADELTVPGFSAADAAVGDLDGDGVLDVTVLALDDASQVVRWLGNGDGTFGPAEGITVPTTVNALAVEDLNGDGRADLALLDGEVQRIDIHLSDATGAPGTAMPIDRASAPSDLIALADVVGTDAPDLLIAAGMTLDILPGNGDGTFGAPMTVTHPSFPFDMAVADANADGRSDVLLIGSSDVTTLLAGEGDIFPGVVTSANAGLAGLAAGDVNLDGAADLAGVSSDTLGLLLSDATGAYTDAGVVSPAGLGAARAAVGDFDGDGAPDLVSANPDSGGVTIVYAEP